MRGWNLEKKGGTKVGLVWMLFWDCLSPWFLQEDCKIERLPYSWFKDGFMPSLFTGLCWKPSLSQCHHFLLLINEVSQAPNSLTSIQALGLWRWMFPLDVIELSAVITGEEGGPSSLFMSCFISTSCRLQGWEVASIFDSSTPLEPVVLASGVNMMSKATPPVSSLPLPVQNLLAQSDSL